MAKRIDLTGQRFGRLVAQEIAGRDRQHHPIWRCVCDCGNVAEVAAYNLRSGRTTSCGCRRRENMRKVAIEHGGSDTRLYNIWRAMRERCLNRSASNYKDYGGRGITICGEWLHSFAAFRDWSLANGYRADLTIDRKDNDGPYCPENCRWSTYAEQANNRRSNRLLSYNGETHTITRWAELSGLKPNTLYMRLRRGWSVELALTTR